MIRDRTRSSGRPAERSRMRSSQSVDQLRHQNPLKKKSNLEENRIGGGGIGGHVGLFHSWHKITRDRAASRWWRKEKKTKTNPRMWARENKFPFKFVVDNYWLSIVGSVGSVSGAFSAVSCDLVTATCSSSTWMSGSFFCSGKGVSSITFIEIEIITFHFV